MFSAAIWDNLNEKLVLVRDRLGIKPLYYFRDNQSVLFASEIRSLFASGLVPKRLNKDVLSEYLQYQCVHAPRTMVKDVALLEAGCYLEISDNSFEKKEYWRPWQVSHEERDPIVIQKSIREKFTKAVEKRMVADVPVGAFLSGGIDSSLIVGTIAERLDQPIDTFNVSFNEGEFSEAPFAKLVAKKFETNHHEILLSPNDFLESLPDALKSIDHPSGDGPNSWIVSRETKKQGISVALSGLGGDEVFAGYDVFKQIPKISDNAWLLSFPKFMRSIVGSMIQFKDPGIRSSKTKEILTSDYFDLENLYPVFRKVLLDAHVNSLLGTKFITNSVKGIIQDLSEYPNFERLPVLSRISIAEMSTYMQNVLIRDTDQMSMAHSLEVRVPFLDHELIEYMIHVPDRVKYPHSPKKLLVDSFRDLLPAEITNRKKMGFVLPWESWMKTELKDFCEERLDLLKEIDHFDTRYLENMWLSFLKNDSEFTWSRTWPLVVLADWIKTNEIEA
jgi:asparagine synthase (glutamine-hydrolysing)